MSIKISQVLPINFEQTRDFIYRPEVLEQWLGGGSRFQVKNNALVRIPDITGRLWHGIISRIESGKTKHEILIASFDSSKACSEVFIRVTACANNSSRVRITITGIERRDNDFMLFLRSVQRVLLALKELVGNEYRQRERVRQAVIIVHGMGQQLPGETLNQFTHSVFPDGINVKWQKPDYDSNSFEVRKITVNGTDKMPTTDVYEFYWAHLMQGNTLGKVTSWAFRLLLTPPQKIPRNLRPVVIPIQVLAALIALTVFLSWVLPWNPVKVQLPNLFDGPWDAGQTQIIAVLITTVLALTVPFRYAWKWLGRNWAIDVLGDVPSYLQPRPENIQRRQAIREAGVDLLERLHTSQKYDRIVMVGHSLGSVIAYDILTFAWIRFGRMHRSPGSTRSVALSAIAKEINDQLKPGPVDPPKLKLEVLQELQHQAWAEYRKNSLPWLVTDFVTLGSPLTHADLLLKDGGGSKFEALKQQRVLPTCPPTTEKLPKDAWSDDAARVGYQRSYTDIATGQRRTVTLPHQAGMFALTRWTNLYFPFHAPMWGDPVAGPVVPEFGTWIRDVELPHYSGKNSGIVGFAHTRYWTPQKHGSSAHIEELRKALRLDTRDTLQLMVRGLPYFETSKE